MERGRAALFRRRRGQASRLVPRGAFRRASGGAAAVGPHRVRGIRQGAGRHDGGPGRRDGEGRPQGHLPQRLAGRRGREPRRADLPRSVPVPGRLRPGRREAHQQRPAARGSDRVERGQGRGLDGPDPGRRRGRVRRGAERVRADEGDDRGGGRRRALRGPARQREEVRAPGRQGVGAHGSVHPHLDRGEAGLRRARGAHRAAGAHGRAGRHAPHLRHRRARPALRAWRAVARRVLLRAERPGRRHRARRRTRHTPT